MKRSLATILAAGLALATLATLASADSGGPQTEPFNVDFFYGDFDEEVALFAGARVEDFCTDTYSTTESKSFHREDGSVDVHVNASGQPLYLYNTALGGPELIDETCAALHDDDPTTNPPTPFATGTGTLKVRDTIHPDGVIEAVNGINGHATGSDGTQWKVRSWADLVIEDGIPQGHPAEFQGLDLHRIGN